MFSWKFLAEVFEVDGSLPDIWVFNTTVDDWQKVVDWLKTSAYALTFRGVEGEDSVPERVQTIFDREEEISSFMSVNLGRCILNCHFVWSQEIDFDLDPREMTDAAVVQQVFDFMTQLGNLIGKPVDICPEGAADVALFRYDPAISEVIFNPDDREWLRNWAN